MAPRLSIGWLAHAWDWVIGDPFPLQALVLVDFPEDHTRFSIFTVVRAVAPARTTDVGIHTLCVLPIGNPRHVVRVVRTFERGSLPIPFALAT